MAANGNYCSVCVRLIAKFVHYFNLNLITAYHGKRAEQHTGRGNAG